MANAAYQTHKQNVLNLFKPTIELAKKHGTEAIVNNLQEAEKNLVAGKLLVAICGEFRRGKSSLINALLNEQKLFPVELDVTTTLVTTITYGETEKITVFLGELGQQPQSKVISRAEIPTYASDHKNRTKARMLVIESPNPQLHSGLVLADTPGIGSLNTQHTDITYALIPKADVVLFVCDILAPLTTEELKFLEMIDRYCQNVLFVLTKKDQVPDYQAIVETNRDKIAQTLKRPPEKISIIAVSNTLKQSYLQYGESEDLEDSNFPVLEAQLWQLLNQQGGAILCLRALKQLSKSLNELRQPLVAEWEIYQAKTSQEVAAIEQKFQQAQQELQKLSSERADWRVQLSDGCQDIRTRVLYDFQTGFTRIRKLAKDYTEDNKLLQEPQQILTLLQGEIRELMTNLDQQLIEQASTLINALESRSDLSLNPLTTEELLPVDIPTDDGHVWSRPVQSGGLWSKILNAAGAGLIKGSVASFLGGTIGGILIGGPVGGLLSWLLGMAGFGQGVKEQMQNLKEREKGYILQKLNEFINEYQTHCNRQLTESFTKIERDFRDDLLNKIKQKEEVAKKTVQTIAEARKLNQEQAAKQTSALQAPLLQSKKLLDAVNQLAEIIFNQSKLESTSPQQTKQVPPTPQPEKTATSQQSNWGDFARE